MMPKSAATFGRSDIARLLDIPEWLLANFASTRYPYGLAPSARRAKGRGQKGLYSLGDVYKIAVAHRLVSAGLTSRVVAAAVKELFPKGQEPIEIAERTSGSNDTGARHIVIDVPKAPWIDRGKLPAEWRLSNPQMSRWALLVQRKTFADMWTGGQLRVVFTMPFDELLDWVNSRILGRKVTFERSTPENQKEGGEQ